MKRTNLLGTVLAFAAAVILAGSPLAQAADVSEYGVLKGQRYTQSDASTPGDTFVFYWMSAYARMTTEGALTDAEATPPGGSAMPLFAGSDPTLLELDLFGGMTVSDLNTAYPNGGYSMGLTTLHDGSKRITLNLNGDTYPNTPTFLNFAGLEQVDATTAFNLTWSAFAGGTASDFIQVRIVDGDDNQVFSTPAIGVSGALSGTATSVTIPAGTLAAENYYTVTLTFMKVITRDTTNYPGATGVAAYYKRTETTLATSGSGTTDTTPPTLTYSYPLDGATGVAVNLPILFAFDEPMASTYSVAWSANVNAGGFVYSWSNDKTTLTCTYTGSLPSGSQITWKLNPTGQTGFKDVAGNALPANVFLGSFTTSGSVTNDPCDGGEDGRGGGMLSKSVTYVQTSAAAPVLDTNQPPSFFATVTSPTNNGITSAKLQVPGGPLLTLPNLFGSFLAMEEYDTQAALDTARPNGSYGLQLTRSSGATPSANISLAGTYPPIPQILNYAACQSVNPAAAFTVQWNGFSGAGADDYIYFSVMNTNSSWHWSAPDPCVPRDLAKTATSITIPAGTLQAGTTYVASLGYSRLTHWASNAIPDIDLTGSLGKSLNFTIITTGGSAGSSRFTGFRQTSAGKLELKIQGTAGQSYVIETASSPSGGWSTLNTQTIPAGGEATFEVTIGTQNTFFRARTP